MAGRSSIRVSCGCVIARGRTVRVSVSAVLTIVASAILSSQAPVTEPAQRLDPHKTEALAARVNERILALQEEASRLASQSRTLIGQLRRLQIERDLQIERAKQAQAEVVEAETLLRQSTDHLNILEQQRVSQLPDLRTQLVELYKQGRGGYVRMLLNVLDVREFGRAMRAVASLTQINAVRAEKHRRTLEALRAERAKLADKAVQLQMRQAEAQRARSAAERAVAARTALVAEIDRRRDLNAQFAGELQVAREKLNEAISNLATGGPVELVSVPMAPFRGALDWPVSGRVQTPFSSAADRAVNAGVRNGIELAAAEGTPVRAVHSGVIGYADSFTGYGTLVIVDHGANHYSLYGYLSSTSVQRGDRVDAGDELGRVGLAPNGNAAVYFELRIDGRSVDPVQWLKPREVQP
jgi:septal ring factor EnvC (AmiA/AmiB activator)